MKDCEKYQEMISAMLDNELSSTDTAQLKAHLELCPECKTMYEAFSGVSAAINENIEIPESLHSGIMNSVNKAAKSGKKRALLIKLRPYATAAACLVVIVASLLTANRSSNAKSESSIMYKTESTTETIATNESQSTGGNIANDSSASTTATAEAPPAEAELCPEPQEVFDSEAEEAAIESPNGARPADTLKEGSQVILDAEESDAYTIVNGEVYMEHLNKVDTQIWIISLIEGNYTYAGNVSTEDISFRLDVTRENGEVYTLYFNYGENHELLGSKAENGDDCVLIADLADFVKLADSELNVEH